MAKWDDLKAAREGNGQTGTPMTVIGIEQPKVETPPPAEPKPEQPRAEDGKFVAAEKPAVETKPAETPPPPTTKEVEIDGQKIALSPELADAFERAESITKANAANADRDRLKDELRAELRKELAPPPKSEAELAAEIALRRAEEERNAPKPPDTKLLIENPDEWQKQNTAHQTYQLEKAKREAKEEAIADVRKRDAEQQKAINARTREILREQFYVAYPVLKPSNELVDIVMNKSFDDLIASGRLNQPMTPSEQEEAKKLLFADIAAQSSRKVVAIMNQGKTKIAPVAATPPPTLNSSQPKKQEKPPEVKADTPKEKYPAGSISAVLAARRAKQQGVNA